MALIGNITILHRLPITQTGGVLGNERSNFSKSNTIGNTHLGEGNTFLDQAGFPNGHLKGWMLPQKAGGMSSYGTLTGTGTITNALGQNGLAATATLAGTGVISNAAMGLIVQMLATLAGSGNLTAGIIGQLQASATLAGSGNLTAAQSALAGLVANLVGSGAISGALATALGQMTATIYVNQSQATVDQIVEGVVDGIGSVTATIPNLLNTETGDLIIPLD